MRMYDPFAELMPLDETKTTEEQITHVLDQIRPVLQSDGGDIEFVEFIPETGVVSVRLVGACAACPMADATIHLTVEGALRKFIPSVTGVERM